MSKNILIVENNLLVSQTVKGNLESEGISVQTAQNSKEADAYLQSNIYDLLLVNLPLAGESKLKTLTRWHKSGQHIITMTAYEERFPSVEVLKAGSRQHLIKPIYPEAMSTIIGNALNIAIEKKTTPQTRIIYSSECMMQIMKMAELVSQSDFSSLLITGESGVGKGELAKTIHEMGSRSRKPFVEINCSALPANLIESELFGHKKGAFTDAKEDKKGLFEMADGGTVFLDEIGEMDTRLQSKLLKAIEEKQFRPIGGTRSIKVDVAIMAATNAKLQNDIDSGRFRLDLYYRLNVIPIHLPPLRKRREDIPALCQHFLNIFNKKFKKNIRGFSDEAFDQLMQHTWPGNIRELANVVERGSILAQGNLIGPKFLMLDNDHANNLTSSQNIELNNAMPLVEMEKIAIKNALREAGGNKNEAARILGVHRSTLYKKLEEYSISGEF